VAHSFNSDSSKIADAQHGLTDFEYTNMRGTPYLMRGGIILGSTGSPAHRRVRRARRVNLSTGGIAWDVPLGAMGGFPGSVNLGGPIVTAGGLSSSARRWTAPFGRSM